MLIRTLLILMLPCFCIAQEQGSVWVFGNNNLLDFNTVPPTVGVSSMNLVDEEMEGSASISDSHGQLLFYCDGRRLWDWNNQIILDTLRGHQSATQGVTIVPRPGYHNEYYILTLDAHRNELENGFRFTHVTACKEEGVAVVSNQVNVELDSNMTEKLCVVKHSNGTDYWILGHRYASDLYRTWLISEEGIQDFTSSATGLIHAHSNGSSFSASVGQMKASPNGTIVASTVTNSVRLVDVMMFNPSDGTITHILSFSPDSTAGGSPKGSYGVSFSADSDKLYLSSLSDYKVWQFTTSNLPADIEGFKASRELVYSGTNNVSGIPESFQQIQLGNDGKIYLVNNGNPHIAVIHEPNLSYPQCNFEDSAIVLQNPAGYGLPTFMDSYDYSISGVCDTGVGITEQYAIPQLEVYPNPTAGEVRFNLPNGVSVIGVEVYDMLGKRVLEQVYKATVNVAGLPNGNYIIAVITEERSYRKLLVVE